MTDNEIMRGLQAHIGDFNCNRCTMEPKTGCADRLCAETISLITRLTAENAALLEYAKLFTGCDTCRNSNYCKTDSECNACEQDVKGNCYCKDCERGSNWEWRGLPGTTEEGDKHE